jgi:hypothetical protein
MQRGECDGGGGGGGGSGSGGKCLRGTLASSFPPPSRPSLQIRARIEDEGSRARQITGPTGGPRLARSREQCAPIAASAI